MPKRTARTFRARLERLDSPLQWVVIRIPFNVGRTWGTHGQLKVKGEINGFTFRTSLFPRGNGRHILLVNKQMQRGGRTGLGMTAHFRLEPDTGPRIVSIPAELKRILSENRSLGRWMDNLNFSTRNDIAKWIAQPKSAAARERRSLQIAERMCATMEAERDIPPVLQVALAQNARAREGWELMPPAHRRKHLFAIFYYRTPEARARRTAKVAEDAAAYAEKKSAGKKNLLISV